MDGIILQRNDRASQSAAGCYLVAGFQLIQHGLPFFLSALLRHDQQKIKDGEDKNDRRKAQPPHAAAPCLYRHQIWHRSISSGYIRNKPSTPVSAGGASISPRGWIDFGRFLLFSGSNPRGFSHEAMVSIESRRYRKRDSSPS